MKIHSYQADDKIAVQELMALLQDFLSKMDFMGHLKPYEEFDAAAYLEDNLASVEENEGKLLVAEIEGRVVGCISGWIKSSSKSAEMEEYPNVTGYISDLFVVEEFRDKGVGRALMQEMEKHFKQAGCDNIRVTVFAPNEKARVFYQQEGYKDFFLGLIKKLT